MRRLAATVICAIFLAGCASGRVLTGAEADMAEAATLSAETGTVIWIAPLHDPERMTEVGREDPLALAVTAGWYKVAYACDVPDCGELVGAIMIREYITDRNIRTEAGRRYELTCSCRNIGVLNIREFGDGSN